MEFGDFNLVMCRVNSISCNAFKRKLQRNLFIVAVCLCSLVLGSIQLVGKLDRKSL